MEQFLAIGATFFLILTLGTIVFALLEYWLYKRRERQPKQAVAHSEAPAVFTVTEAREKVNPKPAVVQSAPVSMSSLSTNLPLPKPSVQRTAFPPPLPKMQPTLVVEGDGTQLSMPARVQPTPQPLPQLNFTPISAMSIVRAESIPTEERLIQGQTVSNISVQSPDIFGKIDVREADSAEQAVRQIQYQVPVVESPTAENEMAEMQIMMDEMQTSETTLQMTAPMPPPVPVLSKPEPDTLRGASAVSLLAVPVSLAGVKAVSKPIATATPLRKTPVQTTASPQKPVMPPKSVPTTRKTQTEKNTNTLLWY